MRSSGVPVTLCAAVTLYEVFMRCFKWGVTLSWSPAAGQPHFEGAEGCALWKCAGTPAGEGLTQRG